MMRKRGSIATSLSLFLMLTTIATGCFHEPDGTAGYAEATSLDGTIACGGMECTSGQLCAFFSGGIDAGIGNGGGGNHYCESVPDGCVVRDCQATGCPACVRDICVSNYSGWGITVSGRELSCPGQ